MRMLNSIPKLCLAQRSVKTLIFACAYALVLCVSWGSTVKEAHATGSVDKAFFIVHQVQTTSSKTLGPDMS